MRLARVATAALLVSVLAGPAIVPEAVVTVLNYTGLFALVAIGIALLTGIGGMTSFGQAAFVGIGAYATAYLTTAAGISPWITLWISVGAAALAALLLGALTLRLAGHYLPLSTIAWSLSLYYLVGNLDFLGGRTGISGVPVIEFFGLPINDGRRFSYLIWAFVASALLLTRNLLSSREGRAIRCLKNGRVMAEAMGVNIERSKLTVFLISAVLAAISGWLYAHFQRFVNPTPFGLNYGIEYLFMAVVGGVGYIGGAVLGSGVITVLKDWFAQSVSGLFGLSGNYEDVILAVLIIVLLQRAPDGLWPSLSLIFARWHREPEKKTLLPAAPLARRSSPASGMGLLKVHDITKRFGGLVAVDRVSLDVKAGEIIGLLGPNGAGKSTMFNLMSGITPATSGEVTFLGQSVTQCNPHQIAKLGMNRTFQHVRLLTNLTVLENVAIGAHLRGHAGIMKAALHMEREEEARILAEAARQLDRVGLGTQAHRLAGTLPLGDQRILETARALASDPCLLLLDEPAAGLRLKEKHALADLLLKLRAEGLGILLVEHDMDFVMGLVDRIVVMDFGRKIAEGLPNDIRNDPAVLKAYLGAVE